MDKLTQRKRNKNRRRIWRLISRSALLVPDYCDGNTNLWDLTVKYSIPMLTAKAALRHLGFPVPVFTQKESEKQRIAKRYTNIEILERRRQYDRDYRARRRSNPVLMQAYREKKRELDRADRARNLQRVLKERLSKRIYDYLRGTNSMRTYELVGCDHKHLVAHLLLPFPEGSNLFKLLKTHQIDHIDACANFDLSRPLQQLQCFHYTNLQLLSASDNARKWIW
jgi:hypothetical protein